MYYFILTFILVPIITTLIVLTKFKHYKEAAHFIKFAVFIIAGATGILYTGLTSEFLAPYFTFGPNETLNKNISVVRWHQRTIEFSNGETVHSAKLLWLWIFQTFAFIIVIGVTGILLKNGVLFITNKFSPDIHKYLLPLYSAVSTITQ